MVLEICVAALLCVLGLCLIAEVAQRAMRRLRVDPTLALLWLGVAERPVEPRSQRRLPEAPSAPSPR